MTKSSTSQTADYASRDQSSDKIKRTAEEYGEKAQEAVNEAIDHGREAVDQAKSLANDGLADLEKRIRQNPLQSAAIAAGIGFLLALIARR